MAEKVLVEAIIAEIERLQQEILENYLKQRGLLQTMIDKSNMDLEAVDRPQREENE